MQQGSLCFRDLLRHVHGISAKTLTKELREMELNDLVTRMVQNTRPVTVQYTLTEHGISLDPVISILLSWGLIHREHLTGKNVLGEKNVNTYIAEIKQEWAVNRMQ